MPPIRAMIADEEPTTKPVTVAAAPQPEAPKPEPESQPARAPVEFVEVAKAVAPEPAPEAPKPPSLVGTWRIVDMIQNGQSQPMPPGMEWTMTFDDAGGVLMSMSGGPGPGGQQTSGSYTLSGESITITMQNETKSGTLTFDGSDRATFAFDDGRIVLARQ